MVGSWQANKEVNAFVFENLFKKISKKNCPRSINLQRLFVKYLREFKRRRNTADELAEKWRLNLERQIEQTLSQYWDTLGIPRPIAFSDNNDTLITWTHPRFIELSGIDPPTKDYFSIVGWLESLTSKEFLFPCAYLLALLGAERIYITEGPRDEGIDCIGRINDGFLRSICFFVQAKTSNSMVSRDVVLMEYGKYKMLPISSRYNNYLNDLKITNSSDGMAIVYLIATNNEFRPSARSVASNLGILLRSKSQLAYMLSSKGTPQKFINLQNHLQNLPPSDGLFNLAPLIKSHLGVE